MWDMVPDCVEQGFVDTDLSGSKEVLTEGQMEGWPMTDKMELDRMTEADLVRLVLGRKKAVVDSYQALDCIHPIEEVLVAEDAVGNEYSCKAMLTVSNMHACHKALNSVRMPQLLWLVNDTSMQSFVSWQWQHLLAEDALCMQTLPWMLSTEFGAAENNCTTCMPFIDWFL